MGIQVVLLCLSFILTACVQMKSNPGYIEKMNEELGDDVQRVNSPAGELSLFFSKESISDGQELLKLMVVENETEKILFQDALPNATLSWHSDSLLLVEQRRGILQKDVLDNGMSRFLLNPRTGKKTNLPQNTNSH